MAKLIGAFWFFSLLLFLVFFFYGYAGAPEQFSTNFGQPGQGIGPISKAMFFYLGIGLFLVLNISIYLGAKLLKLRPQQTQLNYYLRQWLRSFAGMSNIFLTCLLMFLGLANGAEQVDLTKYDFLVYLGPILLIVWLVLLGLILVRKGRPRPVV